MPKINRPLTREEKDAIDERISAEAGFLIIQNDKWYHLFPGGRLEEVDEAETRAILTGTKAREALKKKKKRPKTKPTGNATA